VRATLPQAVLCFMHPVKTAGAIAEAYSVHGVRTFSLDCQEELDKIVAATTAEDGTPAADLRLCVRLRVSSEYSELSLASKFGIDLADAAPLLQATRQVSDWLGICFHVGSQAMTPFAYVQALERVRAAIVFNDTFFAQQTRQIADAAARHRVATLSGITRFAEAGNLINYGAELLDNFRRAATYVDKILKGAKPGDLPFEQPTRYYLTLNLKTAKALGLTIPQSLLVSADKVI